MTQQEEWVSSDQGELLVQKSSAVYKTLANLNPGDLRNSNLPTDPGKQWEDAPFGTELLCSPAEQAVNTAPGNRTTPNWCRY